LRLQKRFVAHMKKIVFMKKNLYEKYHTLLHFKATTKDMLNRIRYVVTFIEGAGSRGGAIPEDSGAKKSKSVIDKSLSMLDTMNTSIELLTGQYHEKFQRQEEFLQNTIFSVKKHSLAFSESLKYRQSLLNDITKKMDETIEYIEECGMTLFSVSRFSAFRDLEEAYHAQVKKSSGAGTAGAGLGGKADYRPWITSIKEYVSNGGSEDYRTQMLISLFLEFSVAQSEGVQFF